MSGWGGGGLGFGSEKAPAADGRRYATLRAEELSATHKD